jgi:flagellin
MSVINTNVKSLVAQDAIMQNGRNMSTSMQRLSTGLRINSAADDAAGLSISTRMTSQVRGLTQAIRNANDGISVVQTAGGALEEVTNMLQRMRELSVQSVSDSYNADDRKAADAEVQQLKSEIDRIASTTQFNNMNILDGSFKDKVLQIGDKGTQTMKIAVASAKTADLGGTSADTGANTLVSGRINFGTATTDDIKDGQIKINNVALKAFTAGTDDIGDIVADINAKVPGVKASAFNAVVADVAGTGVLANGTLKITVNPIGNPATNTLFSITASNSMSELVNNINKEAGGLVQASINDQGKLVLSNDTGATITIEDTGTPKQSGFTAATAKTYQGFLQLESTNGAPVQINKADLSNTTLETRNILSKIGMRETVKTNTADGYTVRGAALTAPETAWLDGDLKINGVNIYEAGISTTNLQGKVDTINQFTNQTGVHASMFAEQTFKTDGKVIGAATEALSINGVTTAAIGGTTANDLVTAINSVSKSTNVTARLEGTNIVVTGRDTNAISITTMKTATGDLTTGATSTVFGTAAAATQATIKAGIQLDSVFNKPISIQLSDAADSNTSATNTRGTTAFGFLEQNVGAADFDTNKSMLNPTGAQSLTRLNVLTSSAATNAIAVIDNAIQQVSASRSNLGAIENRLDKTINNLTNIVTNTSASRSRILDTDYGVETTNLARTQIIQQAATAMLAQANQSAQGVLALLK